MLKSSETKCPYGRIVLYIDLNLLIWVEYFYNGCDLKATHLKVWYKFLEYELLTGVIFDGGAHSAHLVNLNRRQINFIVMNV